MLLTPETYSQPHDKVVVCYCAAWCRTCSQYQPLLEDLSKQFTEWSFIWVDIEKHPEWLIDDDIEDFPTVLLQNSQGVKFFGTLLPHIEHLKQLIEGFDDLPVLDTPTLVIE